MIDGKKLVLDYLRSASGVAVIVGNSVRTTVPGETQEPWVQGHLIDLVCESEPVDHLMRFDLQLDCYAGRDDAHPNWPQANALGYAVRDALRKASGVIGGATVTAVKVRGPRDLADPDFNPARPRTIVEAEVFIHA